MVLVSLLTFQMENSVTKLSLCIFNKKISKSLFYLSCYYILLGWLRGFVADYGVPLMILVWTAVSYMPTGSVPKGIPRRLFSPNPWSPGAYENWTVMKAWLIDRKVIFAYPKSLVWHSFKPKYCINWLMCKTDRIC